MAGNVPQRSSIATSGRCNYPSPKFVAFKSLLGLLDVASPYYIQPSELRNPMLNVKPCLEAKPFVRTLEPSLIHRPCMVVTGLQRLVNASTLESAVCARLSPLMRGMHLTPAFVGCD